MTDPEADWPVLRVSDSDIDTPEDPDRSRAVPLRPAEPERPPRRLPAVPLRWCVAAAVTALLAAGAAVGFAGYRARTITSVQRVAPPPGGVDAAGCPPGDTCTALSGAYSGLAQALTAHLPGSVVLFSSELVDSGATAWARRLRIVQLPESGVRVLAVVQCRPDQPPVQPSRRNLAGSGPAVAVLVRPVGTGCALSLVADVPAGQPVPAAALLAIAADPDTAIG
ncbi:MAG TPA: hypothetical protein VHO01_09655 [Jatrophihabitans sp.]|nr:hypothetical protein [Jatrophihabitans sp.]